MKLKLLYNSNIKEQKMARVTSQAAVEAVGNRYDLVLIASVRARELKRGHQPLTDKKSGNIVTALREIEEGKIGREYLAKSGKR
jgi:DNA-directed RNA polymerase subunit omega